MTYRVWRILLLSLLVHVGSARADWIVFADGSRAGYVWANHTLCYQTECGCRWSISWCEGCHRMVVGETQAYRDMYLCGRHLQRAKLFDEMDDPTVSVTAAPEVLQRWSAEELTPPDERED